MDYIYYRAEWPINDHQLKREFLNQSLTSHQ
jgi:hypothetical protein